MTDQQSAEEIAAKCVEVLELHLMLTPDECNEAEAQVQPVIRPLVEEIVALKRELKAVRMLHGKTVNELRIALRKRGMGEHDTRG